MTPTVWAGTSPAPTVIAKCSGEVYPRLTQVVFGFCHLDSPCPLGFDIWALVCLYCLPSTNGILTVTIRKAYTIL